MIENIIIRGADPSSLLPPDMVESSPMITRLKTVFSGMIPSRFGNIRTYISPVSFAKSVIRADCQNTGCGTRAFVHIERKKDGNWVILEDKSVYDRTNHSKCNDCIEMLELRN